MKEFRVEVISNGGIINNVKIYADKVTKEGFFKVKIMLGLETIYWTFTDNLMQMSFGKIKQVQNPLDQNPEM